MAKTPRASRPKPAPAAKAPVVASPPLAPTEPEATATPQIGADVEIATLDVDGIVMGAANPQTPVEGEPPITVIASAAVAHAIALQADQPVIVDPAGDQVSSSRRWLRMETGISGPEICLSRGDKHPFCDSPAPDGGPSEAQRMVDAGFALDCDPPAEA